MEWRYKSYMNINQIRNERRIARVKSSYSRISIIQRDKKKKKKRTERNRQIRGARADLCLMKIFTRHQNQITRQDYFYPALLFTEINRASY